MHSPVESKIEVPRVTINWGHGIVAILSEYIQAPKEFGRLVQGKGSNMGQILTWYLITFQKGIQLGGGSSDTKM